MWNWNIICIQVELFETGVAYQLRVLWEKSNLEVDPLLTFLFLFIAIGTDFRPIDTLWAIEICSKCAKSRLNASLNPFSTAKWII